MDSLAGSRQGQPMANVSDSTPPAGADHVGGRGDDAEQLTRQFQQSPVGWNAHVPATTTTTTTTATTTTTTVSVAPPTNPEQADPPWVQNLPKGWRRGDECFREKLGNDASLLDEDGRINTRFTRNPAKCADRLVLAAEKLAFWMTERNDAVADLAHARKALGAAEAALKSAQTTLEVTRSAARRQGRSLDDASLGALEAAESTATRKRDAAKRMCADLEELLKEKQGVVKKAHAALAQEVGLSEAELARRRTAHEAHLERIVGQTPGPFAISPQNSVIIACGLVAGAVSHVMGNRDMHLSRLLDVLKADPSVPGREATLDMVYGALIGLVIGLVLLKAGKLDNLDI